MAGVQPHHLLHATADGTRLRLLRLLAREELNVQELVRILGGGQPRVSRHLAVLRDAGWLRQRREGTWSWYAAVDAEDFAGGADLRAAVLAAAAGVPEAAADDAALTVALAARAGRARDFYAGAAAHWDDLRRAFDLPELNLAALVALVPPGLHVLDVGTGTGALLPLLVAAGCRVTAVDHSAPMLARARALGERHAWRNVRFQRADLQALPLRDAVCDAAFAAMVLHHVARPGPAVAEMARVVRPGGRVVLIDFTRHDQTWMREQLAHQWLGFDGPEVERWLRQAGLTPLSLTTRPAGPPVAPAGCRRAGAAAWPAVFLAVAARPGVTPDADESESV